MHYRTERSADTSSAQSASYLSVFMSEFFKKPTRICLVSIHHEETKYAHFTQSTSNFNTCFNIQSLLHCMTYKRDDKKGQSCHIDIDDVLTLSPINSSS